MTNIEIRLVEGQEMLDIVYQLDNYAFRPTPPFPNREEWETRLQSQVGTSCYALFEDQQPVAVVVCPRLNQNVRGKLFPMLGFAGIATHPGARRKGYVRQMMRHILADLRPEERPLSCLYPFRESFYQRLGYVTFPQTVKTLFKANDLAPLLKRDLGGQVELNLIGEVYDQYLAYLQALQPEIHGMALFDQSQKQAAQSNRSWVARAVVDGEWVGVLGYTIQGEEMMNYKFQAVRFCYSTSQGKYLLLEWMARHVDQAGNLEVWLPAYEQPNTWLADLRPKLEPAFVAPMGRVCEVAGLAGLQAGPGSFSARISDPDCPWNEGIWQFLSRDGRLEVSPAQQADCQLTIQGLSALVYGVNDPGDFAWRAWGDPDFNLQQTMRAMFPNRLPYLHEYY